MASWADSSPIEGTCPTLKYSQGNCLGEWLVAGCKRRQRTGYKF